MRTTSQINNSNSLYYLNKSYQKFNSIAAQMANEQQVVKLEDNPLAASQGMKMISNINRSNQYITNLNSAIGQLSLAEGYLATNKGLLDKVNTLTIGSATSSTTPSQRQSNAMEVNQILQQIVTAANANDGTRYVFGGTNTAAPPFNIVNGRYVNYLGNDERVSISVDRNGKINTNLTGTEVFGNMVTKIPSRDLAPGVSLNTDHSTKLSDLNGGSGAPTGKIMIYYSAYPNGLEVDITGCDTLEDVKDKIESATLTASRNLDAAANSWLDSSSMDWHDLQDRYVKVTVNPEGNGISLQEVDLGEPLPEPNSYEKRAGVTYSGANGYEAGGYGVSHPDGGSTTVHDKEDVIYNSATGYYAPLRVDNFAGNKVADGLGIRGTAGRYDPNSPDQVLDGYVHGKNLQPTVNKNTLLADLQGYNDSSYTITNGDKPASVTIRETSNDVNNVFTNWNLTGLANEMNTGANGNLYAKATYINYNTKTLNVGTTYALGKTFDAETMMPDGTIVAKDEATLKEYNGTHYTKGHKFDIDVELPDGTILSAGQPLAQNTILPQGTNVSEPLGSGEKPYIVVEIYSKPLDQAKPSDMVATGTYTGSTNGGTVSLKEVNNSGVGGSVGINLSTSIKEGTVELQVDFPEVMTANIHVPAFEEETVNGKSKDVFDIASGWNIRGLDKPPATGYDENHPPSTDLDGNVSVNYRYENGKFFVELCRPAYGDQPACVVARGELDIGGVPTDGVKSGRVELKGVEGFEQVSGSVYIEIPKGMDFTEGKNVGATPGSPTTITYQMQSDAPGGKITLGGNTELAARQAMGDESLKLAGDTLFKKGQVFDKDVILPSGGRIQAGAPLNSDLLIPKGTTISVSFLEEGTILAAGQTLTIGGNIATKGDTELTEGRTVGYPGSNMSYASGETFKDDVMLPDGSMLSAGDALTAATSGTLVKKGYVFDKDVTLPDGNVLTAGQALANDTIFEAGSEATATMVTGTGATFENGSTFDSDVMLPDGTVLTAGTALTAEVKGTLFKQGQVFDSDMTLPDGSTLAAGTPLATDTIFAAGTVVQASNLEKGTILSDGQSVNYPGLAAGTVLPRGSYYNTPSAGFPAEGMGLEHYPLDPDTGLPVTKPQVADVGGYDLRATFATIEDFMRAVSEAGIYVTAGISADGRGLEFASSLAGAYLTISEDTDCYEQMGDTYQQISGLDLSGVIKGVNSDNDGNVYTEVVYYPPDPAHPDKKVRVTSKTGEVFELDPGYYVRVYSDKDELSKPYADRDNTKMVAEGFLPAGRWTDASDSIYDPASPDYIGRAYDPNNPYVSTQPGVSADILGCLQNMVLEERNDSGMSGVVDLDYYGGRNQIETDANGNPIGAADYSYLDNNGITVFPGGLRPAGSRHVSFQEWDIYDVTPGVTADYSGTIHGKIENKNGTTSVALYKDASHSVMTAKTDPNSPPSLTGEVIFYQVDKNGNFVLDANGSKVEAGRMKITENNLNDGQSDNFTLTTGGMRNTGQDRETNVFSTLNDIMDAMNANDLDKLSDLIGSIKANIDRIVGARGDLGATVERAELLKESHSNDITAYQTVLTNKVGMSSDAMTMAITNYQAAYYALNTAMQVTGQSIQMSLLQYI